MAKPLCNFGRTGCFFRSRRNAVRSRSFGCTHLGCTSVLVTNPLSVLAQVTAVGPALEWRSAEEQKAVFASLPSTWLPAEG